MIPSFFCAKWNHSFSHFLNVCPTLGCFRPSFVKFPPHRHILECVECVRGTGGVSGKVEVLTRQDTLLTLVRMMRMIRMMRMMRMMWCRMPWSWWAHIVHFINLTLGLLRGRIHFFGAIWCCRISWFYISYQTCCLKSFVSHFTFHIIHFTLYFSHYTCHIVHFTLQISY